MNPSSLLTPVQDLCLPLIDQRLFEFFQDRKTVGFGWNAEMSRYHFSTGGKRLRALIPCWVYAAQGRNPIEAIPLGCAIEIIHNATLVHDDLQDGDTIRRGQPTVWKKFSAPQAINCGDALFYFAFQMLSEMKLSPPVHVKIIDRLIRGTLQVVEGQAQEFLLKDEVTPPLSRYLEVIRGKTAALIATSVSASLEALDLDPATCDTVEQAALQSGILFQLQDDLLDIYGDKARDRKATDIAEGKISALVATLNGLASPTDRDRVAAILRTPREQTSDQDIEEALAIFQKYDIRGRVIDQIRSCLITVEEHPGLTEMPQIRDFLIEMNQLFLKPIQSLLN